MIVFMIACALPIETGPDRKFGDQNFKSAVALVELYNVRHGEYPPELSDLDHTGDWDKLYLSGVAYTRLDDGYELNITRGWVGKPTLSYPPEFWTGLGVRRTNVGGLPGSSSP